MITIYIKGFKKPFPIHGLKMENSEDKVILYSGDTKKIIKADDIVWIEHGNSFSNEVVTKKSPFEKEIVVPAPVKTAPTDQAGSFNSKLKQFVDARKNNLPPPTSVSQVEPDETIQYNTDEKVLVEVIFEGAHKSKYEVEVPAESLGSTYTSALGKEVFSHAKLKSVLIDNKVILDGVPVIKGNKLFYKTSPLKKGSDSPEEKMKMAGQMISMGSQINNIMSGMTGQKVPTTDSTFSANFAIPNSPFEKPISLNLKKDEE